jgi:hypothetical protein
VRRVAVAPGRSFAERDFLSAQAANCHALARRLREKALLLESELYVLRAEQLENEAKSLGQRRA